MEIQIEVRRGQYRIMGDGSVRQYAADYGEIPDTKGADGDPLDVYRGLFPDAPLVFVINQYKRESKRFDEHKIMLDFYDREQAENAYRLSTGREPEQIYPVTRQQLAWWLQHGNHQEPVGANSFPFDSENETMTQDYDYERKRNRRQTPVRLAQYRRLRRIDRGSHYGRGIIRRTGRRRGD